MPNAQRPAQRSTKAGFGLSELLITLAILGLIATFTIPKVLQNMEEQQNKARGKEAFATLHQVLFDGWQSGRITAATTLNELLAYMQEKLQYERYCPPNNTTGACNWPGRSTGYAYFILHSGATVIVSNFWNVGSNPVTHPTIDMNGTQGPNSQTKDMCVLWFNRGTQVATLAGRYENLRPGELAPDLLDNRETCTLNLFR